MKKENLEAAKIYAIGYNPAGITIRRKRPRIAVSFLILSLIVMLASCGGGGSSDSSVTTQSSPEFSEAAADNFAGGELDGYSAENESAYGVAPPDLETATTNLKASSNKIIYKGELSIGTKNLGELQNKIIKEVQTAGGYVQSSYSEHSHAGLLVRIPQDKFFSFMDSDIFKGEEVERKNISSEDVTLQYSNMTAELESLRIQEERLITYLKSAQNVKEMLEIETQLGHIRLSIKTAEEARKAMDSYINMSEVNISLYSKGESPVSAISFGSRVGYAFEDTGRQIKQNFENFLLACITFIPVLINLMILAVLVFSIYRQRHRFAAFGSKLSGARKKNKKDDDL